MLLNGIYTYKDNLLYTYQEKRFDENADILKVNDIRGHSFNNNRKYLVLNADSGLNFYNIDDEKLENIHETRLSNSIDDFMDSLNLRINDQVINGQLYHELHTYLSP